MKEEQILQLIKIDKDGGFKVLVENYQERVVNIAYSLTSSWADSQDIAQEVFIKVYNNLHHFKGLSKLITWLYRITVNTSYNFLRRKKKVLIWDKFLLKDDSLEQEFKERELKEILNKALEKLPFKLRAVIVLRDIEGFNYQDIARILKCSLGTVESRLFRARRSLQKSLSFLIKKEELI